MTAAETKAAPTSLTPNGGITGFWALFITQFQGAFSDNLFKFLVIFLITSSRPPSERDQLITVSLALFSLPFILFSMAGGFLADRFSKRSVIIGVKVAEIGIMALGVVGFFLNNLPLLLAVIFLMSAQSAFFGPAKYGSLPELLPEARLSWGNGWLGFGTFVAIIAGGVLAGKLHAELGDQRYYAGVLLVVLAVVGLMSSILITKMPAANPTKTFEANFLGDLQINLKKIGTDRVLALAIAGSIYFWFIGALFGEPTILVYSQDVLRLGEREIAELRAFLAIGIGVGSVVAGFVSGRKIEYGLVPLGAFGMATCAGLMALPDLTKDHVAVILGSLGFAGGFFYVPINALIQQRPRPENKGSIIAANAWLTSVGVFLASGAFWLLKSWLGLEPETIFLIGAGVTFAATVYAMTLMPDSVLRLLLWFLTKTLYRIRVLGRDHIPERGGALFVCNHLSLADAVLLQASTDRPIRFIMHKTFYEKPFIKPWARVSRAIMISSELRPREMIKSLQTASDAIRNGEVVCIFAEGQITRIGQLLPFRRGFERIMKDVDAPIVPVALDGVWGSIFSFEGNRFLWKWPRRIPYPITVNYGRPMPARSTPFEVRQKVQELMAEAWQYRSTRLKPLHRSFVSTARRHPRRFAMGDLQTVRVTFGAALVRSVFLARRLMHVWSNQEMVGLLLPPSVGGALTNWAAMLCGKVPVNLNYTLSEESLASCVRQCSLKTVLTSRVFLDKIKLKVPCEMVFIEDVVGKTQQPLTPSLSPSDGERVAEGRVRGQPPSFTEKLAAALMAFCLPVRMLERALGCRKRMGRDNLATIIFSSGSTGEPKGVMLSHQNIAANIEQLGQVFGFTRKDRILGVLPFFHSFGFTGTLALPGVLGMGAVFHANPLDAKNIGPLVNVYELTVMVATPTFLQLYLRGCEPEDFGSLRLVMTGAEKLPERLANAFDERFGIRPFEAYGCTECAPAVTVNTHDFRAAGFRQIGGKRGKIGHPLPGVSVRIVDPETREPLPPGQPGLLLVRGPNVMRGYLGKPEKSAEVLLRSLPHANTEPGQMGAPALSGGRWYVTGDIAALDEDGFLQITDRLSRFSKIGGEMVPHIKVEEKLHELVEATEQTFVVSGVGDEKKGERLVVLHKLNDDALKNCLEKLNQSDLPNLFKPKADAFIKVDAFPLLGTGKLDLRGVREIAQSRITAAA